MKQYLDIVKKVLNEGEWKSPVRKNHQTGEWEPVDGGVRTLACPNVVFSHNMKDGFPLLTTKKMAWKTLRVELEGFIRGITDKQWFQNRGCKIWDEWCNPEDVDIRVKYVIEKQDYTYCGIKYDNKLELRKAIQRKLTDLGPIYGYQWRHFGEHYGDDSGVSDVDQLNGLMVGTDQFKNIVETLRTNPMDRRMVCSAWNPNQIQMMGLPPCHYSWNVTVIGNKLNLFWAQRSCDLMLGVPFNIASYGLLLSLLAEDAGFEVGNLSGMLVDCHIYENQLPAAYKQVEREPRSLPTISFTPNHVDYNHSQKIDKFNIFKWTHDNVNLEGYNPMDKISFGDVVV